MPALRIECSCGQRYSFHVEPVNGRMPWGEKCPTCGLDGTSAANELLAQSPADPPPVPNVPLASFTEPPLEDPPGASYPGTRISNPQLTAAEAAESHASNPGRLRPDWGQVLRNAPVVWQAPLIFIAAAVLGGWLVKPWLFCLAPAGLYFAWDDYRNITSLLLSGDVCPTVILGENPGRVATLANLSATGGTYPVLRVFKEPLTKLAGGPHRRGGRLASVAFYAGPIGQDGNWKSFNPSVINRFVSNPEQIQRVVSSIPEEEWRYLESVAPRFASEADGLYALAEPQPRPMPLYSRGERRALWVAGALVAVIAIGIAGVLISSHRGQDRPASQTAGESGISHFPGAGSPARPVPNVSAPEMHGMPKQDGFAGISVGDEVEVMDRGRWRAGKVVEFDRIRFRVQFKDRSADQWVTRGQLRPAR
jgi:hypothetical protein